jgi:endonuclease YncB( thermonuclease family)
MLSPCSEAGDASQTAEASDAIDGTTFRLADGRKVRLAGVIAANDMDGDRSAAASATAALNALIAGKQVKLYGNANFRDRYDRLIALVAAGEGSPRWIQADLVSLGELRVAPEAGDVPCAKALLDFERRARASRKGVWSEPRFSVERTDRIEALRAAAGRFALVEGTVHRVGETASRTYLDFGRRYSEDFSIIIPRAARAAFAAAGIDLKALRGKHVRVRGVLFSSGGPAIEIRSPDSLEIFAGNGT